VVGNPPYQIEDGGAGASATPIYQHFVSQAFRLRPRYVSMIIPSRWFAGGKGLDSFRAQMLASKNFRKLEIFANSKELFPGVIVEGGVCYFLWDSQHNGACQVSQYVDGERISTAIRDLDQHGETFVQWNEAVSILEKVQQKAEPVYESIVSGRNPFGFATNFRDYSEKEFDNSVQIFANKAIGHIDKSLVVTGVEMVSKWKVLTSVGYGASGDSPSQVINRPIIAPPGSVCTDTYIVVNSFGSRAEAERCVKYYSSKFFRFLVALRKNTQHVTRSRFAFVPAIPLDHDWDDAELAARYNLTAAEIAFIASKVRPMPND